MAIRSKRLVHTATLLTGPTQTVYTCPVDRVAIAKTLCLSVASGAATVVILAVRNNGNGIKVSEHSGPVGSFAWTQGAFLVLEPGDSLEVTVQGSGGGGRCHVSGMLLTGPPAA